MAQRLCSQGKLFVARISHRNARYFSTDAAAKAFGVPSTVIRKRLVPHSAWSDVTPAVVPKGLKKVELPTPQPRYAPDPEDQSWKLFSACKLGEYIAPAASCAARAVGAT